MQHSARVRVDERAEVVGARVQVGDDGEVLLHDGDRIGGHGGLLVFGGLQRQLHNHSCTT